ncbi:unnamed protein product, partial [Rotaria sordida]
MSNRRQKRAQLRALEIRPLSHISSHRHLAELKRILNDEELQDSVSLKHF